MAANKVVDMLRQCAEKDASGRAENELLIEQFQRLVPAAPENADLILLAVDAFGSEREAYGWLTRPHMLLENESPLQVIVDGHAERVQRILAVINYGGVA